MQKNVPKLIVVLLLSMILVSACVPATMSNTTASAGSSLRYVWVQTYDQSMEMWRTAAVWVPILFFLAILLAGIGIGIFFTASSRGCGGALLAIITLAFFGAMFGAYSSSRSITARAPLEVTKQADSASQEGMASKKKEVSMRYAELLNYQFMDLLPSDKTDFGKSSNVVKICEGGYDTESNCAPFEHVYPVDPYEVCVDWDDDDNCTDYETRWHHQHDPDVEYLIRYAAVSNLPDKYVTPETNLVVDSENKDHPLMYFSGWMLPEDYNNHWYSIVPWNHRSYNAVTCMPPMDWLFYKKLQSTGLVMGASSWHQYSNPLLATANSGFIGDPEVIKKLREANMLLAPRDLYSPGGGNNATYFDFVYPLGTLASRNEVDWKGFGQDSQLVNTYYGNVLHISNSFVFVLQSDLDKVGVSIDDLLYNIKADLYNEGKWFRMVGDKKLFTIMQQNTILTLCAVKEDKEGLRIEPTGCRQMSGLPIGNEALKEAFISGLPAELQNISFTPEGVFGKPLIIQSADGKLAITGTEGSPMYLWEKFGAKKPSMDENFSYLVDRIQLSEQEIQQVIASGVAQQEAMVRNLYLLPGIILGLEILVFFGTALAAVSH